MSEQYALLAEQYALDAQAYSSAAANSATNAAGSASSAQANASALSAGVNNASGSAVTASTAAATATTKANEAAASATTATSKASEAAASATTAANLLNNSVRHDITQTLSAANQLRARSNIGLGTRSMGNDIVGAGRPNISATMDANTLAMVNAATSGMTFYSTDGPQGAWVWRKCGATWLCVEGDTGKILIANRLNPLFIEADPNYNWLWRQPGWGTISTSFRVAPDAPLPIPAGTKVFTSYPPDVISYATVYASPGYAGFNAHSLNEGVKISAPITNNLNVYRGSWSFPMPLTHPWPTTLAS